MIVIAAQLHSPILTSTPSPPSMCRRMSMYKPGICMHASTFANSDPSIVWCRGRSRFLFSNHRQILNLILLAAGSLVCKAALTQLPTGFSNSDVWFGLSIGSVLLPSFADRCVIASLCKCALLCNVEQCMPLTESLDRFHAHRS